MTTRQWTIIAVLFAAVLIVFCFGGMLLFANLTPSQTQVVVVKVTGTPLQFLIATPSPTPTLKPAATALPKAAPPPTATATSTSPSTPKPSSPPMSISLTRIADDMKALTVAQRDNYAKSLDGQIVRGKETVEDVLTKGNVSFVRLNVAGYPRSIVGLQDVPLDVTLPLQRGQSITFTAKIDGPALYVGDTFAMNLKLISLD